MAKAASSQSELLRLANRVSFLTREIHYCLEETSQPEPSFTANSHEVSTTSKYDDLAASLNDVTEDLLLLINGPKITLRSRLGQHYDLAAYQTALEFDFFDLIPIDGQKTIDEVSQEAGLDRDRVGRVLRFLATRRVFRECQENVFEHTSISALISRDRILRDTFLSQLDEIFQAASETAPCLKETPDIADGMHSPFHYRFHMPIFEFYKSNPEKGIRFGHAMEGAAKLDRRISELQDGYDWQSLNNGTVVDVGGGNGSISVSLAKSFQKLYFIVQDISRDLLAAGHDQLSNNAALKQRITFEYHDFFSPQKPKQCAVYLIRQCLYNWNDTDCINILRQFIPALEEYPGTPLLINEGIMPKPGETTRWEEHMLRQVDMSMMVVLGSRQRTETDFDRLLKEADSRFKIIKSYRTGKMGLLEVHLDI